MRLPRALHQPSSTRQPHRRRRSRLGNARSPCQAAPRRSAITPRSTPSRQTTLVGPHRHGSAQIRPPHRATPHPATNPRTGPARQRRPSAAWQTPVRSPTTPRPWIATARPGRGTRTWSYLQAPDQLPRWRSAARRLTPPTPPPTRHGRRQSPRRGTPTHYDEWPTKTPHQPQPGRGDRPDRHPNGQPGRPMPGLTYPRPPTAPPATPTRHPNHHRDPAQPGRPMPGLTYPRPPTAPPATPTRHPNHHRDPAPTQQELPPRSHAR
ncbi:hypothetical protein DSM44344_03853 [Mycobacterium marinum]|nr:hypothetical protein DSM44344_03853 [Mycobacterium marinum]